MKTVFLLITHLVCFSAMAQSTGRALAKSFTDKNIKFSTKGHPKSKGVDLTLAFPKSWKATEGERPNVVQVFKGEKSVMALLITKELPIKLSKEEQKEFFTKENVGSIIPENAKLLSVEITALDGETAGQIEYEISQSQAGMKIYVNTIQYLIIQNDGTRLVTVQFSSGDISQEEAKKRLEDYRKVFFLMANSIIFPSKWKK